MADSSSANHFNFLMRDGQTCTISLLRSFQQGAVQLYELEVRIDDALHLVTLRYSALRTLSKLLPNVPAILFSARSNSQSQSTWLASSANSLETKAFSSVERES